MKKNSTLFLASMALVTALIAGCGSTNTTTTQQQGTVIPESTIAAAAPQTTTAAETAAPETASTWQGATGTIGTIAAETTNVPQTGQISEADAKGAALAHAGLDEADVTFTKIQLDYDDQRLEYELEFYDTTNSYEYNIDAVTGSILAYDCDLHGYHHGNGAGMGNGAGAGNGTGAGNGAGAGNGIGSGQNIMDETQARSIVLADAGLSEADVTFKKIELDYDDNCHIYEIEFYHGTTEYEYEINACTGSIIHFEAGHH